MMYKTVSQISFKVVLGLLASAMLLFTSASSSVFAADATVSLLPADNAPATAGQHTYSVQLSVPAQYTIVDYLVWLAVDVTAVTLDSVDFGTSPATSFSGTAGIQDTWNQTAGNVVFARTFDPTADTVPGTPNQIMTLGTVTVTGASNPLFVIVSANSSVSAIDTQSGQAENLTVTGLPSAVGATARPGTVDSPTPTLGPPVPECDLCGYCIGEGADTIPSDYGRCTQCLYGAQLTPAPGRLLPSPVPDNQWTVFGCMQSDAVNYTNQIMSIATAVIGGIAFLAMLYGGMLILTSSGQPGKLDRGRRLVVTGAVAALLVFGAILIFRTVGVDLLRIPGIQ